MNSKTLFAIITTIFTIGVAGIGLLGTVGLMSEGEPGLLFMFCGAMLFMITLSCFVGRYVYLDSRTRGMNVWLWTTIAMYGAGPLGFLMYILLRNPIMPFADQQLRGHGVPSTFQPSVHGCATCGHTVPDSYEFCPNCGDKQLVFCPACHNGVIAGWKYCPHCGKRMPQ